MLWLVFLLSPLAVIHLVYTTTVGQEANADTFGFTAAILDNGLFLCTGTIISKYFILTAAHCFKRGRNISLINLEVGNNEVSCENVRNISHIIIHPRYYEITRDFDIALLRLEQPLQLERPNMQRVNLNFDTEEYFGDATAIGFHPTLDAEPNTTLKLRYVDLNVWRRSRCNSWTIWGPHAHYIFGPLISERMICAGIEKQPAATCNFDDGGPLIANGHELLGVLSWRFDCFTEQKPSVYISVPLMSAWILKVLGSFPA